MVINSMNSFLNKMLRIIEGMGGDNRQNIFIQRITFLV